MSAAEQWECDVMDTGQGAWSLRIRRDCEARVEASAGAFGRRLVNVETRTARRWFAGWCLPGTLSRFEFALPRREGEAAACLRVFNGASSPDGMELRVDGRVVWNSGVLAPESAAPLPIPAAGVPREQLPLPGTPPGRSSGSRRLRSFVTALLLAPALLGCLAAAAPTAPAPSSAPRYETRANHDPDGTGRFYMGREIAQVMGHQAADWLDRPEREQEEAPTKLIHALQLKPGHRVGDVGAGSGYLTFRMARKVGPRGRVYAVDIQPEMLDIIRRRSAQEGLRNVTPILGTITDPKLPAGSLDLILMVDVYHELSHPWEMTRAMLRALKPGGRLVLVEYRAEDPTVPIKPVHKMTQAQVRKELAVHPVRWAHTLDVLPRQHIIIFRKSHGRG